MADRVAAAVFLEVLREPAGALPHWWLCCR
jgi:hypothetical protein